MRFRSFGAGAVMVSEIGLGCAGLGGILKRTTKQEMHHLLQTAHDFGICFFDTSDMYTQGESEQLLGEAFSHNRARVFIATKGGYVLPARRRALARLKPWLRPLVRAARIRRESIPTRVRGALSQDFSPAHLTKAVEGSLRRLKSDYVDLYQLHSPAPQLLENGCLLEPLERLQRQGKIRFIGVSCETPADVIACLKFDSISAVQVALSLRETGAEQFLPALKERGVAVVARQCLAGGMLAGSCEEIVAAMEFVLAHEAVSVALIGTANRSHLAQNLAPLTAAQGAGAV